MSAMVWVFPAECVIVVWTLNAVLFPVDLIVYMLSTQGKLLSITAVLDDASCAPDITGVCENPAGQ